jgi:hypothetical protein
MIFPGIGTMINSFCSPLKREIKLSIEEGASMMESVGPAEFQEGQEEAYGIRWVGVLMGFLQFLSGFVIIGWFWSALWGVMIFEKSDREQKRLKL